MAHFAELDENNIVKRVIVVDNINCVDPAMQFAKAPTKDELRTVSGSVLTTEVKEIVVAGKVETVAVPAEKETNWESEEIGIHFCQELFKGGNWIQTSYNGNIRKNYAGIGYKYDKALGAFIPPQPFKSWILNKETCQWEAPVPRLEKGMYDWNEEKQKWVEVKI